MVKRVKIRTQSRSTFFVRANSTMTSSRYSQSFNQGLLKRTRCSEEIVFVILNSYENIAMRTTYMNQQSSSLISMSFIHLLNVFWLFVILLLYWSTFKTNRVVYRRRALNRLTMEQLLKYETSYDIPNWEKSAQTYFFMGSAYKQ